MRFGWIAIFADTSVRETRGCVSCSEICVGGNRYETRKMMTEDKKKFEIDGLPPFPWHVGEADPHAIFDDAGDPVMLLRVDIAGTVVDSMNMLAEDGWFRPITAAQEELYDAYVRSDTRVQAALTQIEKFREEGIVKAGSTAVLVDLQTPAELLDVLHDVLSGGGSMTYFPCQYAVIPNIGDDGMCVAHATAEFDGKRYCQPHAKALEERYGASL